MICVVHTARIRARLFPAAFHVVVMLAIPTLDCPTVAYASNSAITPSVSKNAKADSAKYPGDTPRIQVLWQLLMSSRYTEMLADSTAIVADPKASPEERCTALFGVSISNLRLSHLTEASAAISRFDKLSVGLNISPEIVAQVVELKYRIAYLALRARYSSSAPPQNLSFTNGLKYWDQNTSVPNCSDYVGSFARRGGPNGMNCAVLKSATNNPRCFGYFIYDVPADNYINKRVQIVGYLRAHRVSSNGALWVRLDSPGSERLWHQPLPEIKGSTGWRRYSVVLDVPKGAQQIVLGDYLSGTGQLDLADVQLTTVGKDVPLSSSLD